MVTIRPACAADIAGIHDCWLLTDYPDPAERAVKAQLGIAPWFPHLFHSGTLLVAEVDGMIVGFAGTQTRGRVCYLADCFVRPDWQSHGVARALLEQLHADPTLIHCTLASSDPRAASRYVRMGMTPQFPIFNLESTPRTQHLSPLVTTRVCTDMEEWLAYDQRLIGHDRRVDIAHLCDQTTALLLQMWDGARLLGQALAQPRRYDHAPHGKYNIGPVAAFQRADAAAVAQSAVAWTLQHGATWVNLRIPGPHPVLPLLLAAGMQTQFVELFCANRMWFDPACYVPSEIM